MPYFPSAVGAPRLEFATGVCELSPNKIIELIRNNLGIEMELIEESDEEYGVYKRKDNILPTVADVVAVASELSNEGCKVFCIANTYDDVPDCSDDSQQYLVEHPKQEFRFSGDGSKKHGENDTIELLNSELEWVCAKRDSIDNAVCNIVFDDVTTLTFDKRLDIYDVLLKKGYSII
ncbi:hypothetical protein H4R24_002883 [Coemansia sp. RSA 988]|nr:hypothetical protein H4R24_002883 [Coemansia sp. RSA 988]